MLPRNIFNRIKVASAYLLGHERLNAFPFEIAIGITNRCNLDCAFCPNKYSRMPRGDISLDLIDHLLEQVAPYVDMVDLSFDGEPFLHPAWDKCVEACHRRNVRAILQTNCLLLDEPVVHKIFQAGLDGIILSIDAATQETYYRLKPGGNYQKVIGNVERFLSFARGNPRRPHVTLQFVRSPENAHEERDFVRQWRGKGADYIRIKPMFNFSGSVGDKYLRREMKPCILLWTSLSIHWNGTIPLCCMEIEGRQPMGDATIKPLLEIVDNEAFQSMRRLHLAGRSHQHAICQHCDVPSVGWPFVIGSIFVDDFSRRRLIGFVHKLGLLQN